MKRREFIVLAASNAFTGPLAVRAAWAAGTPTLGILMPGMETDLNRRKRLEAFRNALAKLGWTEGKNIRIEVRWGGADPVLFASYAAELVKLSPELLFCDGTAALEALRRQTRTIPIVFAVVTDPVAQGFVASLARPDGNITGFSAMQPSMIGKGFGMLTQLVPPVARVAVLYNPATMPYAEQMIRAVEEAALPLAVTVRGAPANDVAEIDAMAAELAREERGGMVVLPSTFTVSHRATIIALASRHRLTAVYFFPYFATEGGLMSYGVDVTDLHIRSAAYVDRILRGEKPGDLPIQLPTKFELVINLKAAKALGVSIAPSLLATADEVIE
jgi:putative ABC transport system substrate-binding protein